MTTGLGDSLLKPLQSFSIQPKLPERLKALRDIAYNLRWAWNHDTIELFRRLDSGLWEDSHHNPVLMLGKVAQDRLEQAAQDRGFLAHLDRVANHLDEYLNNHSTWFEREKQVARDQPLVAYFSAEFAVTECLEIFAGGLGVLAGDHLKSASDLGLPIVGLGLLYQEGYFRQYLNQAGWQQEFREENDFTNLPLTLERTPDGGPLIIEVPYPDTVVSAQIWRAQVGRVALYLLDTNIPANPDPDNRDISDELYGGDNKLRIRQEIMLGIGGYRALKALGLKPQLYHLNEGHAAFLALERIRDLMEKNQVSFQTARQAAAAGLIFTTHTPVAAGHDYFSMELIWKYFERYASQVGLSKEDFLAFGREDPKDAHSLFCMTTLAMKLAGHINAVSQLHGQVTRRMWQILWQQVPRSEIPIGHVTNGVHFRSWISQEMNQLYDRYLGPRWREEPADEDVWGQAEQIASSELWRTHERRRERLVAFVRRRLSEQRRKQGAPQSEIEAAKEALDPRALTIGFARRFASYKRATLILQNKERLASLFSNPDQPLQIIFSGKAHPKDESGKKLIAQIAQLAREQPFQNRLIFLEDYGMAIARYLVQGCDVWLNTPRRPREACGTSGMKAAANGVLNLSILDGWWAEAYAPDLGWAIGQGEVYDDPEEQDRIEAQALYELIEREVIPSFYQRGDDGLPDRWLQYMKTGLRRLCSVYNTHRMVQEYTEKLYLPAVEQVHQRLEDQLSGAKQLAKWKEKIRQQWPNLKIVAAQVEPNSNLEVGDQITAQTWLKLGELAPEDVRVEFYFGQIDMDGEISAAQTFQLHPSGLDKDKGQSYQTNQIPCQQSGRFGYTIRVLPNHPDLINPYLPGLIKWASSETQT